MAYSQRRMIKNFTLMVVKGERVQVWKSLLGRHVQISFHRLWVYLLREVYITNNLDPGVPPFL